MALAIISCFLLTALFGISAAGLKTWTKNSSENMISNNGNNGDISVFVYESVSQIIIKGASVTCKGVNVNYDKTEYTDGDGHCLFKPPIPGIYNITVSKKDYFIPDSPKTIELENDVPKQVMFGAYKSRSLILFEKNLKSFHWLEKIIQILPKLR